MSLPSFTFNFKYTNKKKNVKRINEKKTITKLANITQQDMFE